MDHVDMINRILEADHKAKALTEGAAAERDRLHEDIERERGKLREEYMEQARKRVETESARERAASERMVAELDEKLRRDLELVDRQLTDRREALAEKMFSLITEGGEC